MRDHTYNGFKVWSEPLHFGWLHSAPFVVGNSPAGSHTEYQALHPENALLEERSNLAQSAAVSDGTIRELSSSRLLQVIAGSDGDDKLQGGKSQDTLSGGRGSDTLHGRGGDDHLHGEKGNDTLSGGRGSDTLHGGSGDDHLHGGKGHDTLSGGRGSDTLHGGSGDDHLHGGKGHDTLSGGRGSDTLHGEGGDDHLHGGNGQDTLFGGSGNDILVGGAGDDRISGDQGLDAIYGGKGNDIINGGSGADIYFFSLNDNDIDTVVSFERGIDKDLFVSFEDIFSENKPLEKFDLIDVRSDLGRTTIEIHSLSEDLRHSFVLEGISGVSIEDIIIVESNVMAIA